MVVVARFALVTNLLGNRRSTLRGMGIGALAAIVTGLGDSLAKNKDKKIKRRKKRRRRKKRNGAPPPTCAVRCSAAFAVCFDRAVDSTLCGDTLTTNCTPCFTDQDCVESDRPYCLTLDGAVLRETNEPVTFLRDFCGPFLDAVCTQILI